MAKFRKKPVVIEAVQWFKNGDYPLDGVVIEVPRGRMIHFFRVTDVSGVSRCAHCSQETHAHGWIDTLEGGHIVCPGDWIITGVKGERYPCKPDIFEATYDSAE